MAHGQVINIDELAGLTKEQILEKLKQAREAQSVAQKYEALGISVTSGKGGKARKVQVSLTKAWPFSATLDNWKHIAKVAQTVVEAHEVLLTPEEINRQREELED